MRTKKVITLAVVVFLSMVTTLPNNSALASSGVDKYYEQTADKEASVDDYDYKWLMKKTVSNIINNYEEITDYDDLNVTHYDDCGSTIMTVFNTKAMKFVKGKEFDLKSKLVVTSQKKYWINLTNASWKVNSNSQYISVNDGVCTFKKIPSKEKTAEIEAIILKNVDGSWQKIVVHFNLIISKNAASMDAVHTMTINSKSKLKVNDNSAKKQTIKWKTSNPKIASVSKSGTVTAKSQGDCTITATLADKYVLECEIIVPSKTEISILKRAKGTYSGWDTFGEKFYEIKFAVNRIDNCSFDIEKLDRTRFKRMDVFYVDIYDTHSGEFLYRKTFGIYYMGEDKKQVDFIWWFDSPEPNWEGAILTDD